MLVKECDSEADECESRMPVLQTWYSHNTAMCLFGMAVMGEGFHRLVHVRLQIRKMQSGAEKVDDAAVRDAPVAARALYKAL